MVFPGGHQHPESPIVPLVVTPAAYPGSFVHSYPSYPEVVYPVYPTRGGVRPEHSVDINDQQAGGDQHHDERIVCQEHVKRIKVPTNAYHDNKDLAHMISTTSHRSSLARPRGSETKIHCTSA